ncbi:Protein lysine acetyltransferase Pka [bioreactor metagenome]|uniref:Protein lysine acetyltransferase Pka n=1 Tax=bioreactor metagenome TaxID=1076179 RepID=A0A645CHE8_9ZZZZ
MISNQRAPHFVLEPDAVEILRRFGIPYPESEFVREAAQVASAAERLGYPLVMKIVSEDIVHKSDAGGVAVGISSAREAAAAYERILTSVRAYQPAAVIQGVFLCRMAEKGEEVIIGTVRDEIFGPTVMFGLGGIFVEILKDVTFRVCPVDQEQALEMIREIKGYPVLAGTRGREALAVSRLAELIVKVSRLAVELPGVAEIDLNPVRVYSHEVTVLDARIFISPPAREPEA